MCFIPCVVQILLAWKFSFPFYHIIFSRTKETNNQNDLRSLNFEKIWTTTCISYGIKYEIYPERWSTQAIFFSPLTMMMMPSYTLLCFQLMRQIDLMVSAKKAEWETHVHAVQIQLDKKTKEVEFVKVQLEQKCQEVSVLCWLFSSFIKILHLWWRCKQKAYNYSTSTI